METCLWCTASAESDEAVKGVLKRYCIKELTLQEIKNANQDLVYCLECVVEYHRAREKVPSLHKLLWELETARLLEVFGEMLEEECDLCFVDDGHEKPISKFSAEEFLNRLKFPLMEVLKYPYLLCHRELCDLVVNVLCKMEDMKNPLIVHDQYQGIFLLMVHPKETVRRWAIDTARSLGRVDRDNYYDLQEVFSCMFYILDLGITVDFPPEEDKYCSGMLERLPPHLYDSKNKKNYWLGICMLLMQLDSQAMDSLLMGPKGQASIPQCIINTMTDCDKDDQVSDPFWPALQCFLVILDRLGSKIWCQVEPLDAFLAITRADSYKAEIENIRQKTAGTRVKEEPENDDLMSCSQIVYDCYAVKRASRSPDCVSSNPDNTGNAIFDEMSCLVNVLQSEMGCGMRVYGSTFLWFIPFVRSIMELTIYNSICFGEVIHYLDNNINKDVLSGKTNTCDKVTEFFLRILVDTIELFLNNGCREMLSYFPHIWVEMVLQCATLSDDINNTRIKDVRGVYSAASYFGRGVQIPAVGIGAMSHACIKLIRSLLKEGGITGTVPESTNFLDLINRHMRGVSPRGLNLHRSEYENLKKCLLKLVKAISENPPVSNDVPCAPPTPPSDPSEHVNSDSTLPLQQLQTKDAASGPVGTINFIKDEPLWDEGVCQSFSDVHEEIKAKKEPFSPIPISEFKPFEVTRLKPDLGKLQDIRNRLTANQNRISIPDIANRRLETKHEPGKCSGFKEIGPVSNVSPQPSSSQSKIPESVRLKKSEKKAEEETRVVRQHPLKMTCHSNKEDLTKDRKVSLQLSNSTKEFREIITISDDEVSPNDKNVLENKLMHDASSYFEIKSPGRDYDDLSESQVFEFETQENMASAWNEPNDDIPVVTKKCKLGNDSEMCMIDKHDDVELMDTQPVSVDDIERAFVQVEAQIHKQTPEQAASNSNEKCDQFKHSGRPPEKTDLTGKKGKQWLHRKPPIIEALSQKIRGNHRSQKNVSQGLGKQSMPTVQTSSIFASPSACRGSSASFVPPSTSTPAIVPPKKVRTRVEPESVAERLCLKKRERKAFDLSQHSLDSLGELRSHGQNVHVEPQQKSKRVRQKFGVKKGKKFLASQDQQFIRQRRKMLQKSTPSTAVSKLPSSDPPPKSKGAVETEKESVDEEDDYHFLPCSQPDPDRRCPESINFNEVSSLQNIEGVGISTAEGPESKNFVEDYDDDEWMFLTQNEPTDMELCSQMEDDLEDLNTGRVLLGNSATNQPNVTAGETDLPINPLFSSTIQESLPNASTGTSSNHLFLKPSLPTEYQKKAKPSTVKIYTSSSRSATLAEELGKVANPLPGVKVAKVKFARPPQAPPLLPKPTPNHEFRQPLTPGPTLQPLGQVSKSSLSNVTFASHVPSYKTYPRPESRVSIRCSTLAQDGGLEASHMFDTPDLKRTILYWKYEMFINPKRFVASLELCRWPLKEVPVTFSNYQEYFKTLYPLLLNNAFEEMVSEWNNGIKSTIELKIVGIEYRSRIASASFTARLNAEQEKKQLYPKEDDLVLLWLPKNTGAYANDDLLCSGMSAHFGCVLRSSVLSNGRGQLSTLSLTIQTHGNVSSVNNQPVRCEQIGSLISTLREYKALCLLQKSKMAQPVLKPDIKYFALCHDGLMNPHMPEYNEDQVKAISCGVAMVKRKQDTPKILLIHGPPGTGKSKIIVGMLHGLLSVCPGGENPSVTRHAKSNRMRILVCAPSNAAVDSLMKKIINDFKKRCLNSCNPQGTCGDINLVRLGSERAISSQLKLFSLDNQVKKRLEKTHQICYSDIQRETEELEKTLERLSQQCSKTDKKLSTFDELYEKKLNCLKEREKLSKRSKEYRNKRQEVMSRVLLDAHVICCTLSTSGSNLLETSLSRLAHKPFDCVIVDEAGQAKETETLIPLLRHCQNLILVGDPNQLPPTVISQKAKELGFDQSLMARVLKSLHCQGSHPSPSVFLSVQYRMHPDICEFPSKYIYNNNLKSDRETAQKLCSSWWPFQPYRVFDVTDGKESKEGDSFSNMKEVKLVVLLFKLLAEKIVSCKEKQQMLKEKQKQVGIITPYNAQKQRILEAIKTETDKELTKFIWWEVDTVDGFQGREMDCIIVSCVRANNEIGFVGNRQRMNVTITRAKYSLFILGHLRSLKEQSDWGALIKDAAKRGTIITAHESNFHKVTNEVLKPTRRAPHSSIPAHSDRQGDDRMQTRPSDPRLPVSHHASREQDTGNQSFTCPRPPNCGTSDPRLHQSSAHSFHATPEQRRERHSSSSAAQSRTLRK